MNWRTATNPDDLKGLGAFRIVKADVKREIESFRLPAGLKLQCTPSGWARLFDVIQKFLIIEKALVGKAETVSPRDEYFKSTEARYIFSLLELDGEDRNRQLGLREKHFRSKSEAQKWMREIAREIHPDKNQHNPLAEEATQKLNELYELISN